MSDYSNYSRMEETLSPPDSACALFYDPIVNRFEDEDGRIMHHLELWFKTWQIDAWKKTKQYGLITDRHGDLWEFFYPDEDTGYYV